MKCPVEVLPNLILERQRINSGDSWYTLRLADDRQTVTGGKVSRLPAYKIAKWIQDNLGHIDWTRQRTVLWHDFIVREGAMRWLRKLPAWEF